MYKILTNPFQKVMHHNSNVKRTYVNTESWKQTQNYGGRKTPAKGFSPTSCSKQVHLPQVPQGCSW